ncbi:MAG: dephospho-CoA kinase [Oscillospiraceae bacterium]|nr:dephospho-CoA kinase [Oscillospiraceae bacterium]
MTRLTDKKIVALTGMSGAGKSTVCRCFRDAGFIVIDCDEVAHEVTSRGKPAVKELAQYLSPDIVDTDGALDRRKTAELIFNDHDKLQLFNRIIYPYITYDIVSRIKGASSDVLLDAPTIFEARLDGICDSIVSVCADTEKCIERIMLRDNITRQHAAARLGSQKNIEFFRSVTDICIENNGTEQELFEKANKAISELKGDIWKKDARKTENIL